MNDLNGIMYMFCALQVIGAFFFIKIEELRIFRAVGLMFILAPYTIILMKIAEVIK